MNAFHLVLNEGPTLRPASSNPADGEHILNEEVIPGVRLVAEIQGGRVRQYHASDLSGQSVEVRIFQIGESSERDETGRIKLQCWACVLDSAGEPQPVPLPESWHGGVSYGMQCHPIECPDSSITATPQPD